MPTPLPTPAKPTLRGLFWFGCGGAALIVGGLVTILAANWKEIVFPLQVAIALLPLTTALVLYALGVHRKLLNRESEEVLGIVWSGGVLCATALLGRVLQLSSSSFAFCATVTLLLAPVVLALRATSAWALMTGFAYAAALSLFFDGLPGSDIWPRHSWAAFLAGQTICLGTLALVAWRLAPRWREQGASAASERHLAAFLLCLHAIILAVMLYTFAEDSRLAGAAEAACWLFPFALPLCVGLWIERAGRSNSRALTTLGSVLLLGFGLVFQASVGRRLCAGGALGYLGFGLYALICALLLARCRNRAGAFPLCVLPMALAAHLVPLPLAPLTLQLLVAIGGIAVALIYASRTLANLSLGYLVLSAWISFAMLETSLMIRGLIFLCGGILLLVLNLLFAKFTRNREVPHA